MSELIFNKKKHTYTVEGEVLPSVNQVLSGVGICDYSMIPEADRDRYFTRGTYVHKAMELLLRGELDWDTVDDSILGYVRAGEKFILDTGFKMIRQEIPLYHSAYKYAGTFDAIGKIGDVAVLVDWKTGAVLDHVKYQIGGYYNLLKANNMEEPLQGYGVELKANGKYKMSECWNNFENGNTFLSFLATYQRQKVRIIDGKCERV